MCVKGDGKQKKEKKELIKCTYYVTIIVLTLSIVCIHTCKYAMDSSMKKNK